MVRTALVSTYSPRVCGAAAFTSQLGHVTGHREVVALHPADQTGPYPSEVHHRIRRDERSDYAHAARSLVSCVDVVSIQFEDSIWGGDDGDSVLDFVRALDVPALTTLHSIATEPTEHQRATLGELIECSQATVVMSRSASTLLAAAYGVGKDIPVVIPHGVPQVPLVDPQTIKPALGLTGRDVILSFGFMAPSKGYELAIEALPAVVDQHPSVLYAIVGATASDTKQLAGEVYRESLVGRVRDLGLTDHVRFVDSFVGHGELTRWLEAADVFASPYTDAQPTVSGPLAYAMGAGRAIVSTAYAYAQEMLADGRGVVVPERSTEQFAAALNRMLGDDDARRECGRLAYEYSRPMVWSEVGAAYERLSSRVVSEARRPHAVRVA